MIRGELRLGEPGKRLLDAATVAGACGGLVRFVDGILVVDE